MRPSFFPAVLLLGAVACGDDPFGPDDIVGRYGLRSIAGERFPVLIPPAPPPFRYLVFGGSLELHADRTFALTLIVRTTEHTADGSRILGVGGDVPETEVGTYRIVGDLGRTILVDMTFSANGRFGSELTATIAAASEYMARGGRYYQLDGPFSDYELRLHRPGDPEYVFGSHRRIDN